ncbi:hypothetical protein V493_03842 [Pseudogymnoascus sp. VKM F-4281 (FW-2241)]|nr:hypothetical protein V493_03842 [Pseudogymnoascus sp. VKM F-4281 (FW-2241)]
MVLRPCLSEKFQVVGQCYAQGLEDAESLLGSFQAPWRVQVETGYTGVSIQRYFDSSTKVVQSEDPRLGLVPIEWELLQGDRTPDDPDIFARFRNKITGQEINSDPRLFLDALKARRVDLKTFQLV